MNAEAKRNIAPEDWLRGPFLIITRHDFRTDRKVHLHHYAQELSKLGEVRFFSVGFSQLSRLTMDTRLPLAETSNRVQSVDGVDCYLWETLAHPFNLRLDALNPISRQLFARYGAHAPKQLLDWAADSRFILIESGLSIMLFEAVKRANPDARVVYFASDDLSAIGCSPALSDELKRTIDRYDAVFALSRGLASRFPKHLPAYYLPYGVEPDYFDATAASPFQGGINGVTVGSTLFDAEFFRIAATQFPETTFYLIGCGPKASPLAQYPNVRLMGEMPFRSVLNYFRHADFGIAPYDVRKLDPHFAESSQKLTYMGILGLPAVCPMQAVGPYAGRFGYVSGDRDSVRAAIDAALNAGPFEQPPSLSWAEVTKRLITPDAFPDTRA